MLNFMVFKFKLFLRIENAPGKIVHEIFELLYVTEIRLFRSQFSNFPQFSSKTTVFWYFCPLSIGDFRRNLKTGLRMGVAIDFKMTWVIFVPIREL